MSQDPVGQAQDYVAGFCGEATYKDGWVERADFNGDGEIDILIRFWVACYEKPAPLCGSAGCLTQVWYGVGDEPWVLALGHYALSVEPITYKGVPALEVFSIALACGKSGSEHCHSIHTWSNDEFLTVWSNFEE